MDDSCAVCAEALEWVAYGPCGHREVCSTCVVRLRFICDDRRCCICKTESNQVFVTKALGDYTRVINDFSVLPTDLKEGRVGQYWYHEDTQTVFDDLDHYKMIQAMCKLSCSVCDMEENDGSRRRIKFKNVEQLKGHLYHQHRLIMCSLCLEGRKVFICEQKLYSRTQLNQHINSGDSEVDGTESERGGFMGHPVCEFCKTPFYGDNELYSHMSTEHYTCHICQRQHPGQYEYYKNYDDLEIHFRRDHFLCEDEACLGKKFVVFQSEAEMKRHNALEHGGNMSRSKRIAALQIPTSFRYQRSNEHDNRQGRRRSFRREFSEDHLSMAIQASYETGGNSGVTGNNASSSSTQAVSGRGGDRFDVDSIVQPFESLAASSDTDQPTRYRQAVSQFSSSNAPLEESSFPPLPAAPRGNHQQNPKPETRQHSSRLGEASFPPLPVAPSRGNHQQTPKPPETQRNTMAANLSRKNKSSGKLSNPAAAPAWPAVNRSPTMPSAASPSNAWPAASAAATTGSSSSSSGQKKKPAATNNGPAVSSYSSLAQSQPVASHVNSPVESSSARRKGSTDKINHSTSAPNLGNITSLSPSSTDFPPVAVAQVRKLTTTSAQQVVPKLGDVGSANRSFDPSTSEFPPVSATTAKQLGVPKVVGDVHSANKSLVERIRMGLEFDESKYSEFKEISGKYRQGLMDAESYLAYVYQYGLSHLVIELARLCPDSVKQKELIDTYKYNAQFVSNSNHTSTDSSGGGGGLRKGKGKSLVVDEGNHHSRANLADSIMESVRNLQSSNRYADDEEVEVLSKDGYRAGKGKLTSSSSSSSSQAASSLKQQQQQQQQQGNNKYESHSDGGGGGKSKQQRKKTSKFHRVRLGDGSVAALLDMKHNDSNFGEEEEEEEEDANKKKKNVAEGGVLPVRGVWKNGGGQRLMGKNH